MKLTKYNSKRDFNSTNEPVGKLNSENKLRFVIQHHFARKEHYDFRLEFNGTLVSFAVPKGLSEIKSDKRLAVHVEDHPVDYINFKGEIPKGSYGAGTVEIFDKGTYKPLIDFKLGLKKGHLKFELKGKKTKGVFNLVKTKEPNWIIFKSDEEKTKTTKNPFSNCEVKLAKLTNTIPKKDYLFEIKYDGYRTVAYISKDVKLLSRNNTDFTKKFSSIAQSLKLIKTSMVLDGEVVVFDSNGRSDFGLLTDSIKTGKENFCYVVFDILALDGVDLRDKPLIKRKEILKDSLVGMPQNIIISSYVLNKGNESFKIAKKMGLEGVVAKQINSTYNNIRDEDWLKIKCYKRQEFIIGGYAVTEKNKELSALYVGYYKNNKLKFVGKVGTGFNALLREELNKKFKSLIRKTSPFEDFKDDSAIWIMPKLVCEIQFSELTKNNLLRQPSFIALREDKQAKDVRLEGEDE